MEKDFGAWHALKADIDESSFRPMFHEREIWWCSLGVNVGREEDGKNERFERPVLIFRKFNHEIFWGMPATSADRIWEYYFPYEHDGRQSTIILSQMRTLDGKRLLRKMGTLTEIDFENLKAKFQKLCVQEKEKPPSRAVSHEPLVDRPASGQVSEAEAIVNSS
jgi:mRNA-degrading endonuclease toxin of MazEF toxin-antitoxin module